MKTIARIKCDYKEKFGIPRQSGLVTNLEAKIIFEPEYRNPEALRGIEEFSHLWLIWEFSKAKREEFSPTVRPPRLGGNKRLGVFATRSPFRPNPIGLSCVRLLRIEDSAEYGKILIVDGADLLDGTPIYDVKPYLPYADSRPDAKGGFAEKVFGYSLSVDFPEDLLKRVPTEKREALLEILKEDPRPSYKADGDRVYGFKFADMEIFFKVYDSTLTVTDIQTK